MKEKIPEIPDISNLSDTLMHLNSADADVMFVNQALKQSFNRYKNAAENEYRDYNDDIEALQHTVTEFLDDFIILGYTPDHRRVVVRYAPTPQGYDSLKELSRNFLMQLMMSDMKSEERDF